MEKLAILPEITLERDMQSTPTLTSTWVTTLMANELARVNTSMLTVIDMRELFLAIRNMESVDSPPKIRANTMVRYPLFRTMVKWY
jgi:hypothetical protein